MRCHTAGDVGAMPLTTYEEVSAYGQMIQYVTATRLMPPWYASPEYSHFSNENYLNSEEIEKIKHWVEGGMNEGGLPYGTVLSKTVGVTVIPRMPDTILSMTQVFEQYGIYLDQYQVFVIPSGQIQDREIEGIEFVPGNKEIVRAASISITPAHAFDSLDAWDPRYGYYSFGGLGKTPSYPYWYTWMPQQQLQWYAHGTKTLPAHSDLLIHVHYGPTGKPQPDSSVVRLWFAPERKEKKILTAPFINPYALTKDSLFIAAGTKKIFHASYTVDEDIHLRSLTPQANLLCRNWEIYAEVPHEIAPIKLLKIPDWNFNWKQTYRFAEPVALPKGSVIHCLATYDNTVDNPCNPADTPVDIGWGAHLFNEMFFVHAEYETPVQDPDVLFTFPVTVSRSPVIGSVFSKKKIKVRIRVIDDQQQSVWLLENQWLQKGHQEVEIILDQLPRGAYHVQIEDSTGRVMARQYFLNIKNKGL